MLGLKMETDPRWVNIAEMNISEVLSDHAWCEQKAATNAITIITRHPEHNELVVAMSKLAQEEMEHFERVHNMIIKRGYQLKPEKKDSYVKSISNFIVRGGSRNQSLVDKLLLGAMIEARSCERFKILSEQLKDEELKSFYHELMVSEAGHYTMFLKLARKYGETAEVNKRWEDFLLFEGSIIRDYGTKQTIHG
jgi:tRNA 2-(methylsulfanyl)-N6-isopentenyladenosine37 hydroxylase